MDENLKSNTIRGLKWVSVSHITRQIFQYISTIVLVGFLSPGDFGLMAMALIIIGFLEIFKDLGTSSALIHYKEPTEQLKSSVFWVNLIFGTLISILLYFFAPIFEDVYNYSRITSILEVLSLSFFIAGLSIVHKANLEKELSFHILSTTELVSTILSSIVGVSLAVLGFGVWSLVFQTLANTFLNSLQLWIFSGWRPSFHFKYNEFKTVSSYSFNLIGFNVINYFSRNADYFLIGKFLGDTSLGHYYLAYRIMLYPIQNISWVVSRVLFPSFSIIQNDNIKFKNVYLKLTNSIAIFTFPLMAGIAFLSYEFVSIFFGSNWNIELVSTLIIILAPVGALQSVITTIGNIYQAKGRTDMMFRWSIFATSITIAGFLIGMKWGPIGVAVSYLITNLLLLYPVFYFPFKLIDLVPSNFFRSFKNTIAIILLMLAFLFLISVLFSNFSSTIRLMILSFSGAGVYIIASLKFNKKYVYEFKQILSGFK